MVQALAVLVVGSFVTTGIGIGAASAAKVPGPGIGSTAALAGPDCADTGRIRIPFVYAPQCVIPWPAGADNGGSTSPGVTADSVKVVNYYTTPFTGPTDAAAAQRRTVKEMPAVYQQFFQTWGRKVDISFVQATGSDETAARADAVAIAAMKPFAVIVAGSARTLVTELAAAHIVVITSDASLQMLQSLAPYVWSSAFMDTTGTMQMMIEYVGKRLVGRKAQWAQDPELAKKPRVFGLIHQDTWASGDFTKGFAKYKGKLASDQLYGTDPATQSEQATTMIAKLKSAGVTSVILNTPFGFSGVLTAQATSQGYFPEWLITGTLGQDVAIVARGIDQGQWKAAFGITNLTVPTTNTSSGTRFLHEWYWGNADSYSSLFNGVFPILFSGVHYAGPTLTPESFRKGLFAAKPAGGVACGCVLSQQVSFGRAAGLGYDDYSSWDDFAEIWWDPLASGVSIGSTVVGIGNYRYSDGGKRYLAGQWPRTEPTVFQTQGAVLGYDTPPKNDVLPQYPCSQCPSSTP